MKCSSVIKRSAVRIIKILMQFGTFDSYEEESDEKKNPCAFSDDNTVFARGV